MNAPPHSPTATSSLQPIPGDRHCFVFVVCGAAEHIDTLHYSLAALRRHSRAGILVVTDARRNAREIQWPNVIDVATPGTLDHHQASIYLKTALHRFVPPGPRYCYLDTDVVAVDPGVDAVFASPPAPVRFAADHVTLREFSPYAVRCDCLERNRRELQEIDELKRTIYATVVVRDPEPRLCRSPADYEQRAAAPLFRWKTFLRWAFGRPSSGQLGSAARRRWERYWLESQDAILYEPLSIIRQIERTSGWRRNQRRQSWISPTGNDAYHNSCDHLAGQIAAKFGIVINRPNWQHWNGGVFLFDQGSGPFLDAWHAKTMAIFADPAWRIRDQGTLAATAWEFGLQDMALLPGAFNCITDPHIGGLMISSDGQDLTRNGFLTRERPCLVHVMYRFFDTTWNVWNWVASRAGV